MMMRADQIEGSLEEMRRTEKLTTTPHPVHAGVYIMQGSMLSVHVIDARDLRLDGRRAPNTRVNLKIEGTSQKTQVVNAS